MSSMTQQGLFELLVKAIVLLTALPIHECAHAMVASRLGDQTARNLGRVTLNPLAHLDPLGSILLLLTGFGWAKPVPVMSRNFKGVSVKKGMILVAVAGPLSNLALALAVMIVYKLIFLVVGGMGLLTASNSLFAMGIILDTMITLNIGLAVFNLLPARPLDGGRLLYLAVSWAAGPAAGETVCRWVGGCAALSLATVLAWVMIRSGGSLWLLPAAAGLAAAAGRELFGEKGKFL